MVIKKGAVMERRGANRQFAIITFCFSFIIFGATFASVAQTQPQETSIQAANKFERTLTIARCENHTTHYFAEKLVAEAYRRIGINTRFVSLPCRRSILMANSGKFDGEVGRIAGTTRQYHNLIALKTPVMQIEGVALTKSATLQIASIKDLRGQRLAIVSGERYAETLTLGMNPLLASDYPQLVTLLLAGRIDIGIGIRRDIRVTLASFDLPDNQLKVTGKPLFMAPLFHLVHKKHMDLIPQLEAVFATMWENGDTKKIHAQTMLHLLDRANPVSSLPMRTK
jgi:polar amino acid transport system substrate-binding protein